jgi:pimeloyl-ACP methyl ester carboxylesterase
MTLAKVGEHELDYERSGNPGAPPLLLIMGMSGTSLHWTDAFLDELRPHFDVIAFDHRGVGASTPLAGAITITEMADDAAGLLRALSIERAHVVGISMGGMIAQELALAHPELVLTLTLGCTYCGGEGSALTRPEVWQRLAEGLLSGDREKALRAGFEANITRAAAAANPALYEQVLELAERRAVAVPVIMAQVQACAAHDTSERLSDLRVPTLVVHGTEDEMLPVVNAEVIAAHIPGARLEILDGAGHLFFWEQPRRSAELVREHAGVSAGERSHA